MAVGDGEYGREIRATAEGLLGAAFGGVVRLGAAAPLRERSTVLRFPVLAGPAGVPLSVVVKGATPRGDQIYDAEAGDYMALARRLFNEWAGLTFLSQAMGSDSPAPQWYAGSREKGLIVIEDLGTGAGLDDLLLGDNPAAAEAGLLALAATLGRMHARTIGRRAEYDRRRDALGPRAHNEFQTYEWLAQTLEAACRELEIEPPPGAAAELHTLIATLRDPGPFRAYTHGDPCPDNIVQTGAGVKLLDFEHGEFRHALLDGVYGRIHFPTCWCVNRLPAPIPVRMEAAYRAELAQGCPEARDDGPFYRAVAEACVHWALATLNWGPLARLLVEDEEWGIATVRQRVLLRFSLAAATTAQVGHLEALGAALIAIGARLHTRWPTEADALPTYPAFR